MPIYMLEIKMAPQQYSHKFTRELNIIHLCNGLKNCSDPSFDHSFMSCHFNYSDPSFATSLSMSGIELPGQLAGIHGQRLLAGPRAAPWQG